MLQNEEGDVDGYRENGGLEASSRCRVNKRVTNESVLGGFERRDFEWEGPDGKDEYAK